MTSATQPTDSAPANREYLANTAISAALGSMDLGMSDVLVSLSCVVWHWFSLHTLEWFREGCSVVTLIRLATQ